MYLIVLEWEEKAYTAAEVMRVRDPIYAHKIFDVLADDLRSKYERYGSAKYEWFLSLYDLDGVHEVTAKKFSVGGNKTPYNEITYGIETTAMRRRFLSQRELEGLDD